MANQPRQGSHSSGRRWVRWLCGLFLIGSGMTVAQAAEEVRYCLRASSFDPAQVFLQTRQLRVTFDGAPAGALQTPLVQQVARQQFWPDAPGAARVDVAPWAADLCGQEPEATLRISLTDEQIAALRAEIDRGPGPLPTAQLVARRAGATAAPDRVAPSGTAPAAQRHDWFRLYFATNRAATGAAEAPRAFGKAASPETRFGAVEVSIPHDHRWARIESPSIFRFEWDASPDRHLMLGPALTPMTLAAWQDELARRAGALGKPGVLLFVHGYNNSFEVAAQRAAQLAKDLAFPGPTVLFSWPSDGEVMAYARDEEDAKTAWRQMAEVLDTLTRLGPGVPVHVVAHSMGNRVLTEGLAQLLQRRPGADRQFKQVVLAAPDVGVEEFRQRWVHDLKSVNPPRFTLYASGQDLPVALSAWLHGQKRLGSGGGDTPVFSGLDSIDASALTREWFGLNHSYFGDNETVLSDLFTLIHQGVGPEKRARLRAVSGAQGAYWEFRK